MLCLIVLHRWMHAGPQGQTAGLVEVCQKQLCGRFLWSMITISLIAEMTSKVARMFILLGL
jgi:hypothetical protein